MYGSGFTVEVDFPSFLGLYLTCTTKSSICFFAHTVNFICFHWTCAKKVGTWLMTSKDFISDFLVHDFLFFFLMIDWLNDYFPVLNCTKLDWIRLSWTLFVQCLEIASVVSWCYINNYMNKVNLIHFVVKIWYYKSSAIIYGQVPWESLQIYMYALKWLYLNVVLIWQKLYIQNAC